MSIPELSPHETSRIRIPGELDVLVSDRVQAVIDTPEFQRLRGISQLGLVSWVYPGAHHTRFEHSLGVYRLACEVLKQLLATDHVLAQSVTDADISIFLLGTLLHDIGHWPFCHPIEDLELAGVPRHEQLARELIVQGNLSTVIREQWGLDPASVADFLAERPPQSCLAMLKSVLDGPVDIDKMDYLQRDSLHAGVPYGRNFDLGRLISSFCVGPDRESLAITEKGKTAAEMLVFARYVMFSEVYWHHTVRSATVMLQRQVFALQDRVAAAEWLRMNDADFAQTCLTLSRGNELESLATCLFGGERRLFKRLAEFPFGENAEVHRLLGGKPFELLIRVAELLAEELSAQTGISVAKSDVLIDAPPIKLEAQFQLQVRLKKSGQFVPLSNISPVVKSLATEQFDSFVKKVRVFIHPDRAAAMRDRIPDLAKTIKKCVERLARKAH